MWRNHYRARYENVKRLELTRYPGCDAGTVRFVVAGEHQPGGGQYATRKQKNQAPFGLGINSYGFQIRYVEGLDKYDRALDDCLATRSPAPSESPSDTTAELVSRPAVANSVVKLLALSILIFPLTIFLPITVPWVIVAVRRRRYVVEPHRVLLFRGILYRRQISILHDRIDSIRRHQGLLGKIFGNGSVTLYTAGSSKPDLQLTDTRNWSEIYSLLQRHYQSKQ
jgi:membrane protein YdbS with pleckstrin-like domain